MSLKFLETYASKSTVNAYRWALKSFFEVLGFKGELEAVVEAYLAGKRNYEEDVSRFFASLKGKPPKTVGLCMAAVRTFLLENGIELPALFWRRLRGRRKGSRALMMDRIPSNVELRRILSHMDVKGKALFLVLASSGMRIGEALKLRLGDLELEHEPAKITIRGEYTKTGNPRIAFISKEAKEALEEWLKIRENYIQQAVGRSTRYNKKTEDDRVFPFEDNTAYFIWRKAIEKVGFDKRQAYNGTIERFTVHPHVLRKFFRTRMGSVIPVDVTEALMGHEGYLTEVYRRYSEEDLAKFYLEGEPAILVFTEAGEINKLRREIEERNRQLQTLVNGLTSENMELKEKIKDLEGKFTELEDKFREFLREVTVSNIIDLSLLEMVKDKGIELDREVLKKKIEERLKEYGLD